MSKIDIGVVLALYVFGVSWTILRYANHDRMAFAVVAILSPVIAVVSMFRLIYLKVTGKLKVGPVPFGLAEAERAVEAERQRLFGGETREPMLAKSWQRAYEAELQCEAERVQRIAERVFAVA